jgi:hypothetical protein
MLTSILFLVASGIARGSSLIQLDSNPQNLSSLRPGQPVIFTCITCRSLVIAWSSDHYVSESGLQVFFGADNPVGLLKSSPNNASTANLTRVDGLVLESQLHIVVSFKYTRSSITCFNNDQRVNASISFDVGEKYDLPLFTFIINLNGACVYYYVIVWYYVHVYSLE